LSASGPLEITGARLVPASARLQRTGLIGWVMVEITGTLIADGITLRRTADGRETLSYPKCRDGQGEEHYLLRPADDRARRAIEDQVFRLLGREQRRAS
jgi:hypothetical protein